MTDQADNEPSTSIAQVEYLVPDAESVLSAFLDGEVSFGDAQTKLATATVRQMYHYQVIRAVMRGMAMPSNATESAVWHERQCLQIWTRVDGGLK